MLSFAARRVSCCRVMRYVPLRRPFCTVRKAILLNKGKPPDEFHEESCRLNDSSVKLLDKKSRKDGSIAYLLNKKLELYNSFSYKDCIEHIKPYLMYNMYKADKKFKWGKEGSKGAFLMPKHEFWLLIRRNLKDKATKYLNSRIIYREWKSSVNRTITKREIQSTHFTDDDVCAIVYELLYYVRITFSHDTAPEVKLRSALYLLEHTLVRNKSPAMGMERVFNTLALSKTDDALERFNGVLIRESERQVFPEHYIHYDHWDNKDQVELKNIIENMDFGKKELYPIVIRGEIGCGKTCLSVNAANVAFKTIRNMRVILGNEENEEDAQEKRYRGTELWFEKEWKKKAQRRVIVYMNVHEDLCGFADLEKRLVKKEKEVEEMKQEENLKKKEVQESSHEEEKAKFQKEYDNIMINIREKEKEMRVEALVFLSSRMCDLCKLKYSSQFFLPSIKRDYKVRGECFETTFCVLDDVLNTSALLRVITSTFDGGFLEALNKLNMKAFFGTIYIVCCCKDTQSSISYSESPLQRYWAIDMHPSKTLLPHLIQYHDFYPFICRNVFMGIMENYLCAGLSAQSVYAYSINRDLSFPGQKKLYIERKLNIITNIPIESLYHTIAGLLIMRTAGTYADSISLNKYSSPNKSDLVAYILREFVKGCSLEHPVDTEGLPFMHDPKKIDPIGLGIVTVRTKIHAPDVCLQKQHHESYTEKKVFSFSRAQMLLACCLYGKHAVPMSAPHSFDALITSMFAHYVSAFVSAGEDTWTLAQYLKLVDPKWKVGDAESAKVLSSICSRNWSTEFGNVFFFKPIEEESTVKVKGDSCEAEESLKTSHIRGVIEDLSTRNPCVCFLCETTFLTSKYTTSIVRWNKVLFMINNRPKNGSSLDKKHVREILMSMGLVPDDGMTADEQKHHAESVLLTGMLCSELRIDAVVPVLCVYKEMQETEVHDIKVRVPNAREVQGAETILLCDEKRGDSVADMNQLPLITTVCASPMKFVPRIGLSVTFTRTVSKEGSSPWTYCKEEELTQDSDSQEE